MTSTKLLLALMVAAVHAAPQINQRQVVGDVLSQLQPAIQQALGSLNLGSSSSFSAPSSSFSAPSSSFSSPSSSFSSPSSFRSAPVASAPRFTSSRVATPSFSSGSSSSGITSRVVSQLQPSIAAAVAEALRGSSRQSSFTSSRPAPSRAVEENYGPAAYAFDYKVADDEAQTYISHQENREGDAVTGSYNYVDPTGDLVTVNYRADENGFQPERTVQDSAVQIDQRNIPGPWTGPQAGVDDVTAARVVATTRRGSGASQSDLISQIISALQPRITSAVNSAVGSGRTSGRTTGTTSFNTAPRTFTPTRTVSPTRTVAPTRTFVPTQRFAPRPSASFGNSGQSGIVSSVVRNLQPRISSAVSSALASSRPAPRSLAPTTRGSASSSLTGLFGSPGETNVRIQQAGNTIEY